MYPNPKFCSVCGHSVEEKIPDDDNRIRQVCPQCHTIHYINPKIVLGTIPVFDEQILLCKRAIEPRYGYWTLPAGFMEINESIHEGATRETYEEAGAEIELGAPFTILDVKKAQQVHLFFRARLINENFSAGPESLEVRLFHENEIPWTDLAFQTVYKTLELFFEDRKKGAFQLHTGNLDSPTSWNSFCLSA